MRRRKKLLAQISAFWHVPSAWPLCSVARVKLIIYLTILRATDLNEHQILWLVEEKCAISFKRNWACDYLIDIH